MRFDVWNCPTIPEGRGIREDVSIVTKRTKADLAAAVARAMGKDLTWWEKFWHRNNDNCRRENGDYVGEQKRVRYLIDIATLEDLLALMHDGESVVITKMDFYEDGAMGLEFKHDCGNLGAENAGVATK